MSSATIIKAESYQEERVRTTELAAKAAEPATKAAEFATKDAEIGAITEKVKAKDKECLDLMFEKIKIKAELESKLGIMAEHANRR